MRRLSAWSILALAVLAAFALTGAAPATVGAAPAAAAKKKCAKKKKKCKKPKPKVFKRREYTGTVDSTNPAAPSSTQISLIVQRGTCQPVTGGKAKRGICMTSSIAGEYPATCTKNGQALNGNGPGGSVAGGYLLPSSGTGTITFHQDPVPPAPPAAADTIEITETYKVTAQAITGTATIHEVFQNTDGDLICDGSATFTLKRTP